MGVRRGVSNDDVDSSGDLCLPHGLAGTSLRWPRQVEDYLHGTIHEVHSILSCHRPQLSTLTLLWPRWTSKFTNTESLSGMSLARPGTAMITAKRVPYAFPKHFRSTAKSQQTGTSKSRAVDVDDLLSKPTWSVSTLLPSQEPATSTPEISSKQLHHLLRLSALPPPKDPAEESKMLRTLSSQLHFVKEIQRIDTTGVEPLQSLRDETVAGEQSAELGLEALKDALAKEDVRGKFHKRIRRRRDAELERAEDEWNVLGTASKKTGRYFVVEGGK